MKTAVYRRVASIAVDDFTLPDDAGRLPTVFLLTGLRTGGFS